MAFRKRLDYIDQQGNLRVARTGNAALWRYRANKILGARMVWCEQYRTVGGPRTWSEAKEMHDLHTMDEPKTIN